jgi:two-component sensor histidine kinase
VRDEGTGLPADFDIHKAKGLGMRIVNSLAKQMHGAVSFHRRDPGAEFVVTFPL